MTKRKADSDPIESQADSLDITADIIGNDDEDYGMPDLVNLPILPLRNMVLFPGIIMPVSVIRESSLTLVRAAFENKIPIGLLCQLSPNIETPSANMLHEIGVIADVIKVIELPDGSTTAIVKGRMPFMKTGIGKADDYLSGRIMVKARLLFEVPPEKNDIEYKVLIDLIREKSKKLISMSGNEGNNLNIAVDDCPNDMLINMMASSSPIDINHKQALLYIRSVKERGMHLLTDLAEMEDRVSIIEKISERTQSAMDSQQRNAFLQQQLESIRTELYGSSDDATDLRERALKKKFPKAVAQLFDKEVDKLERTNPQSPDYSVSLTYLETLLDLPWGIYSKLNTDFFKAKKILDDDHYGLEKVKERILEQLALMINNPNGKSPIICLVGAPGVGKTSLGQSIARALGRKYQRVSLGGLHDEAEIRGHRRTYIGAMPGRIIDAIKRAGSANPVLLLDEVDKIGNDYKGDPSAALLEVLDPEQNCHFHDNYIDVDFDLSKVLFIATANTLQTLSQPLIDRMEIIEISGYLVEEKVEIAKQHIIPRLLKENNVKKSQFKLTDKAIETIIDSYTSESGVRQLEKQIATLMRKSILARLSGTSVPAKIDKDNLRNLLGVPRYTSDLYEGNDFAGVVTGLAWTAVGGEILFIESSLSKGKGEKLTLTGNLGDVMKESAVIALQYIKANAEKFGIDVDMFDKYNVHIHVPEGAIPKDGPSAGITMATSLISAFTHRKVKAKLAMTGEITLRGKVLPVGGIKEKILAAKRAGINEIIISEENRKDIDDIAAKYLTGLTFHYVKTVIDVFNIALTDEIAE
ncbi:MAG: endopeptidase La [Muribaculaceae bacterium]|nr:endopeptidase La [Muribaculaceae bacterium]